MTDKRKSRKEERSWKAKPILSSDYTEDPELHNVFVGVLKDKRNISLAIKKIPQILPGFQHLKRCSASKIILTAQLTTPKDQDLNQEEPSVGFRDAQRLRDFLTQNDFDLTMFEDDFLVVAVPQNPPRTKEQASKASRSWPVNFHADQPLEAVIGGSVFSETHLDTMEDQMRLILEAAKVEAIGNSWCNGSCSIVDPKSGKVLSLAASRTNEHPMWHASMLAIDLLAHSQGGGSWNLSDGQTDSSTRGTFCYPRSIEKLKFPDCQSLLDNSKRTKTNGKIDDGPYLATGYWAFMLLEPCPLCAMALLHSRVARIFYAVPNKSHGVLGTKTLLHYAPGLNHRYQVWSGILEEECTAVYNEIISKKCC